MSVSRLLFCFLNHRKQMIVYIHLSDVHTHSLAHSNFEKILFTGTKRTESSFCNLKKKKILVAVESQNWCLKLPIFVFF